MKRLLIPALLCLASCSNSPVTDTKTPHSDTTRTVALYVTNTPQRYLAVDYIFRITKDTFALALDSSKGNYSKKWSKDTLYFAPTQVPILDSLKRPVLDSLKKPLYRIEYQILPTQSVVQDFNKKY